MSAPRSTERQGGVVALVLLLCAPFLSQADATIANVATPSIQSELGASTAVAELVVGGYLTAYAAFLITGARLGQLHGYRTLLLFGAAGFGVASLIAGLAPSPWVLVAARIAQGASAAMMYPQALNGIQALFTGAARARAIGSFALALAGGAVSGQILGGVLVWADIGGTSWRGIFLINVPVCAVLLLLGRRHLPRSPLSGSDVGRLDLAGVAMLTASLLAVVLPLSVGPSQGWPLWAVLSLVAAGPTFLAFVRLQRRAARCGGSPLIDVTALARRPILTALIALLTATATYYALLFSLAQFLQHGMGRSTLFSGIALVPWVAAFGIAGRLAGRLSPRRRTVLAVGGYTAMTAVYATIAAILATGTALPDATLMMLLAVGGAGLGAGFNSLLAHLTDAVAPAHAADISGVSTTTLQVGGAIGVATLGSIYLTLAGPSTSAATADHALATTLTCAAVGTALAAGLSAVATRTRPTTPAENQEPERAVVTKR